MGKISDLNHTSITNQSFNHRSIRQINSSIGDRMKEEELKERFKSFVQSQGFIIEEESRQSSPDLIIEKNGRRMGIELKGSRNTTVFAAALGQLLFAKFKHNVEEMWLILPRPPSLTSKNWIELLWNNGIKIFFFSGKGFLELKTEFLRPISRRSFLEIDKAILNLLKERPEGVQFTELCKELSLEAGSLRYHLKGRFLGSILKDKIKIENDKIKLL